MNKVWQVMFGLAIGAISGLISVFINFPMGLLLLLILIFVVLETSRLVVVFRHDDSH